MRRDLESSVVTGNDDLTDRYWKGGINNSYNTVEQNCCVGL